MTSKQSRKPCLSFTNNLCILLPLLLSLLSLTPLGAAPTYAPEPPSAEQAQGKYWVTASTGKTHNRRCRYYENSRGYYSSTGTGNNCKICGGAG